MTKLRHLYATIVLGVQFFIRLTKRIFMRPSPGLSVFLNNYREDGIPTISPGEKQLLYDISRCVSCRLCDVLCPALIHTNPAEFLGPAFYPSSASRLITDYPYAKLDTDLCSECAGCDTICPERVPIRATFALMQKKVAEVGG